MKFAYIINEQIVEFRDIAEGTEVDPVMLRPVVVVPFTVQPWQIIVGIHHDIFADHVDEVTDLTDRLLSDVQRERLAELEELFLGQREAGFAFNADHFPLTEHGAKRQDLIRRSSSPGSFVVLNSGGALVTMPNSQKNAWLTAGDDRFTAIFTTHDSHVAGIMATTTPEEAATYNVADGWPELVDAPLFEEPQV